jgi:hypothetical protein
MEKPTLYTIIDKNNNLVTVEDMIVYCYDEEILREFITTDDFLVTTVTFSFLEQIALTAQKDLYELNRFGGTFKLQKTIIFGSELVH